MADKEEAMEPMTLGTPVGSPAGTPSSPTSPYLPAYLMGENPLSASTPRSTVQSRQQTPKTVTFSGGGLAMPSIHTNTQSPPIGPGRTLQSVTSSEKPTSDFGPPVLGLFDTLSPLPGGGLASPQNSTFPSTSGLFSPIFTPVPSYFATPLSSGPSQGNPPAAAAETSVFGSESQKPQEAPSTSEMQGNESRLGSKMEGEQNTWVTVFGFMPSAVNDIIAHFVHCGTILEHKWGTQPDGKNSTQRCNWIHLRFRTVREARRAIAKNGKVFGGCMMVGVIPCEDPSSKNQSITSPVGENSGIRPLLRSNSLPQTEEILRSQKENVLGPELNFPVKPKTPSTAISGIRPLGLDFMEASGSMKSNGFISRTIDFLFGQ
ncbi:hypothetical protein J437_LFUL006282 [Ladona fulva]|uniref:Nucleoporin NUP35 n=1 Tax=Ladona fulva TaxID=123851 RepID=A0A8K0K2T2_LADFU|nr:hypothetical protein J437_LFUL006282 [Ladona fulva]